MKAPRKKQQNSYKKDIIKTIDRYIESLNKTTEKDFNSFEANGIKKFNEKLKNNNIYAIDKFGLPVRFNEKNKNSIFGWRLNDFGEIININVEQVLIDSNNKNIYEITKQKILNKNKSPNSIFARIIKHLETADE